MLISPPGECQFSFFYPPLRGAQDCTVWQDTAGASGARALIGGASVELPWAVVVLVAVPLLLLVVEFTSCVASCPGSVDDEVPAAVKQEAGPPPVGCVAPRRPDALPVHALRLHSAGGEELDVVRREGRRGDIAYSIFSRIPNLRYLVALQQTMKRPSIVTKGNTPRFFEIVAFGEKAVLARGAGVSTCIHQRITL